MFAPTSTHFSGQVTTTVDTIDTVTTVDTITEVANVTSVDTVDQVNNVSNVFTVNGVSSVVEVDQLNTVLNVNSVDKVDQLPIESVALQKGDYGASFNPVTLYSRTQTQTPNSSYYMLSDGDTTARYALIFTPRVMAISHYNNGVDPVDITTILKISYYADDTTSTISTQLATLNAATKVTLTGNMYRIVNIEIDDTSPDVTARNRIYLFDNAITPAANGIPANFYESFIIGPITYPITSQQATNSRCNAVYYSPPNRTTLIKKLAFSATNQTNELGIKMRIFNSNNRFKTYDLYLGAGYTCCEDLYITIPPGNTLVIYCARLTGTNTFDVSCMLDMIQFA